MQQNLTSIVLGLALMTSIALPASRALGQASQEQANTARVAAPSADSPLAKPVVSAAAELKAQRTTTWNENGTQWLLLEGDVSFSLGIYGFRGNRAVAQIETERRPGNPVRHIAVYLDDAKTLGGGPIGAEATRLLVTASTVGDIKLVTDLRVPRDAPPDHALVDAGRSRMHRV
ncbi:MAG: hypothetical protein MI741_03150, partial [Rhodospirillales bacterium]|nr:hypothetical protein [Rhodospirillales bacterium]